MFCQQCGAEESAEARSCSKCGGTLAETAAADQGTGVVASPEEATSLPRKKYSWKMWFLVILLVIVLGGGAVIGWRLLTQPKLGATHLNPIDNAEMVWVPGGTFVMGSPKGVGEASEHPAHKVTLSGYWMYKYEVTVAQYRAFCAATSHALPSFPTDNSWKGKTGWDDPAMQKHPIVNISWNDAKAYAAWAKVALPSEAQWEYAARGPEIHNYPWGGTATATTLTNGWDQAKCANHNNSRSQNISTWPVGSFPAGASWCGAQDLAGNVCEWCADWFGNYTSMPENDPTGPASGTVRVLRGGSWSYYVEYNTRSAYRFYNSPDSSGNDIGFRCVMSSPGLFDPIIR